jgi:hypothetical protein
MGRKCRSTLILAVLLLPLLPVVPWLFLLLLHTLLLSVLRMR